MDGIDDKPVLLRNLVVHLMDVSTLQVYLVIYSHKNACQYNLFTTIKFHTEDFGAADTSKKLWHVGEMGKKR